MNSPKFTSFVKFTLLAAAMVATAISPARADQTKANNNTALQSGGSWVSGTAPGAGDTAIWNATVSTAANCTNTLGSAVAWKGIAITNPAAPIVINGSTTLTISNGINMSSATKNLTLNCGTISVATNQTWTVASGMTVTTGSATNAGSVNAANNVVTLAGGGTWTINGTGDNGSLGITASAGILNLGKTSSSGAHAVGGPGLTINSGATAKITGTGGDQIYNGGGVTVNGTLDLNGNSEAINGFNGSGTVTTTLAGGAAVLTIGASGTGGSFTGTMQAGTNGSITLTESGAGSQSVSCITRGSGTAGPFIFANAGTLILNGTADNAFVTASVTNGATLLLAKTSSASAHAIGTSLTIASGGLVQITGTGGDQIYNGDSVAIAGTFDLNGNSETIGSLAFTGGVLQNSQATTATLTDGGSLTMSGNVTVNDLSAATGTTIILQYSGTRSGTGTFVAGSLPAGAHVVDNTTAQTVSIVNNGTSVFPRVFIPTWNTNEAVVAATTPQQYGAKGDGVTDDSAAFQNAINAVYNSGHFGGGVVYVPAAFYVFSNNITIPTGVTLHGDWTDWTKGTNGLVGTTFKIFVGAGQTNGTAFITMSRSTALRGINFWYPNQNPASITGYPFTISAADNDMLQNIVLVNSYKGIQEGSAEFILSTVIGTPLYLGFATEGVIADICHTEDVRFSPAVWPASLLTNAPAVGGSYATWMRANGTGMQVYRMDGLINVNTEISGYNTGMDFESTSNGQAGCSFYKGWVTNCATAVLAQEMQTAEGLEFSDFTLDSDVAVNRTHATNDAAAEFDNCVIIGRNGTAVSCLGADWQSSMSFQNCVISNTLSLTGPGVFNLVNCRLLGSTQCVLSATATTAAFTGCTFSPSRNIINNGTTTNNLLIDSRQSISNAMPVFDWTNVMANFATRKPASTTLYVATNYGATGNGTTDDTVAIQNALTAAGAAGGGIVYLTPGTYHVTNTLDIPSGVELRGPYEARHHTWPGADNIPKGAILWPYGGQGSTSGPPAITMEANSGMVGMTISYESQWTNCFAFPPAIQGRGANIYMIGIQCPNPYYFVDLDTYTCTNHFLDMVDGWALKTGVHIGNGSSGTVVDCHANWTFWIDNFSSPHALQVADQPPVINFVMHNLQYYVLGNCTELFVKDFSIIENMYIHCSAENGVGPTFTGISAMCDATYQCFVFDSTAPCTFNDVNVEWLVSLNNGFTDLTNQAIVLTTTNFQGTVRFFNSPDWGSHNWDYIINGGDVGMELVHLWQYAFLGSQVNGGVFHLINCGAFSATDGSSGAPYHVAFGANAGVAGKTNEVIGCFAYAGWNVSSQNVTNLENVWMDYAISNDSVLSLGPVVIGDIYPDGIYQFESSNALTFMAYSPYGINSTNIAIKLTATNLFGSGYASNYTTANGLTVTGTTAKSVSLPLPANGVYGAVIQVTDANGNGASNSWSFDTVSPALTFEAEDFDYNGGSYFANPVPDAYAGLSGVTGVDFTNGILGEGSASYRPQGLDTEGASDKPRLAYAGYSDYDTGFANRGNWGNYTRSFPAGNYNIFIRAASDAGPTTDSASLSQVTSGQGTTNQTIVKLGTFSVPNTASWQSYVWVPLLATNGSPAVFSGGTVATLRVTTDNGGYNANYYLLIATNMEAPLLVRSQFQSQPVAMHLTMGQTAAGQFVTLQWPGAADNISQPTIYYAASLTPPVSWTIVTNSAVYANGQWIITLPVSSGSGFYRF